MIPARLIQSKGTTVTAKRRPDTRDAMGAIIDTDQETIATVTAWIQPAGGSVISDYAMREIRATHAMYCAQHIGLTEGDQIISGGQTYVVVDDEVDQAGLGKVWVTILETSE